MSQHSFCSEISLINQEPIIGTVTPTSAYLLLEYPRAWGPKAIPDSELPETVKNWLNEQTSNLSNAKSLLIRGEAPSQTDGIHFYVTDVREQDPALYAFELENYESLLGLDIPAILAGAPAYESSRHPGPLLLVCTNGRRDACCAREGLPVYRTLLDEVGSNLEMIWQVSHVGGHRFAANMICLPHGLFYGRVDPKAALSILEATRNDQVYLPNLRGRSLYAKVVQAAEYHLRTQSGETALDAYQLQNTAEPLPGTWQVSFAAASGSALHHLRLQVEEKSLQVYTGCTLDKKTPIIDYHLEAYEVVEL